MATPMAWLEPLVKLHRLDAFGPKKVTQALETPIFLTHVSCFAPPQLMFLETPDAHSLPGRVTGIEPAIIKLSFYGPHSLKKNVKVRLTIRRKGGPSLGLAGSVRSIDSQEISVELCDSSIGQVMLKSWAEGLSADIGCYQNLDYSEEKTVVEDANERATLSDERTVLARALRQPITLRDVKR